MLGFHVRLHLKEDSKPLQYFKIAKNKVGVGIVVYSQGHAEFS